MPSTPSESFITSLLQPSPWTILTTIIVVLLGPLLLHFFIFRAPSRTTLPSFLLFGPSGSGKTSLLTLLERGQAAQTRISQAPLTVEISLPLNNDTASNNYRSENDPANQIHKRFLLADTPGHGKLRHHAFDSIIKPENTKGMIFMVDAANLSPSSGTTVDETDGLRETAEYLHEILLVLQKRSTGARTSKAPKEIAFLIAANKLDLFTALPPALVKSVLESEISKVRGSRTKGMLGSGIGVNELAMEDEKDRLGDGSEGPFEFKQMEQVGISVEVLGGNVVGVEGADVAAWWAWIGRCL